MEKNKTKKDRIPASAGMALSLRRHAEDSAAHLASLMVEAEKAVVGILHGEHRQRKSGSGERFWQFREYHPGDRPQDIDWRQSGKTDRVFIRQKEWQTNQSAFFWCSRAKGMDFRSDDNLPTKADAAKIITLALGLLMTHSGEEIGMLGSTRKGRSEAALQAIAENLMDETIPGEALPGDKAPRHSALFLAGDFLSPPGDIQPVFKNLSAQSDSGFVIQILDPAEIELPYDGRVVFEEPSHDKQRELVNNVSSIRAEYRHRVAAHIAAVKKTCLDCEWHHVLHPTNRDIKNTLLEIWTTLSLHTQRAGTLPR